jgi:hypothetical protein
LPLELRQLAQQMVVALHRQQVQAYPEFCIDQLPYSLPGITERRLLDRHKLFLHLPMS